MELLIKYPTDDAQVRFPPSSYFFSQFRFNVYYHFLLSVCPYFLGVIPLKPLKFMKVIRTILSMFAPKAQPILLSPTLNLNKKVGARVYFCTYFENKRISHFNLSTHVDCKWFYDKSSMKTFINIHNVHIFLYIP